MDIKGWYMQNETVALQIPVVNEQDAALLEQVAELQDRLGDSLAPAERLHMLEQMAYTYARMSSHYFSKMWAVMTVVKQEGLWRLPAENGLQKFRTHYDYVQWFFDNIKKMSRATIARHTTMANVLMLQIGIQEDLLGPLIEDKPSITQELMDAVVEPYTGDIHLDPEHRSRIARELGYGDGEDLPDDKSLLKETFTRLAEAEHQDAGQMVKRIRENWKIWIAYNPREDMISIQGIGKDNGKGVRFAYEYKREAEVGMHKKAKDFLLTHIRPDNRRGQ